MPATKTRPIATNKKMPSQDESQNAQGMRSKPAAQTRISEEPPGKRRRIHSQGTNIVRERVESPDHIEEAFRQARAAREDRHMKRLRDAEADIEALDKQHAALKTSHHDHKTEVEAGQTAIKASITRLEKDLKQRPTSTDLNKLGDTEREARQQAFHEHVAKMPGKVAEVVNATLQHFKDTKLKSMFTAELAPTRGRIDTTELALDTIRKTVDSLKPLIEHKPDFEKIKTNIVDEVKREVTEASGKMLVNFTTQLDTRINQCTSYMETITMSNALKPLEGKIGNVSDACTSIDERLAYVSELEQKHTKDSERRHKELENALFPTQHSHAQKIEQLDKEVQALREDLHAERKKTSSLETCLNVLGTEVRLEREERRMTEANNEAILRRLQQLEQKHVSAKEAQDKFDAKLKQVGAQTATTLLTQERTVRTQLEGHIKATNANAASLEEYLNCKLAQQKAEFTSLFDKTSSASDMEDLRIRMEELETTSLQKQAESDKASKVEAELTTLREAVVDLAASTSSLGKHVDNIRPMLIDITELKDQHQNHVINCKAQILEHARLTKAQSANTESKLRGCIREQELALRRHLFEAHDIIEKPAFLQRRAHTNKTSMSTHERRRQTALAVRVRRDAMRIARVSSGVQAVESKFNYLSTCLTEDVQNLEKKVHSAEREVTALAKQYDDFRAQQTQLNIRVANLEAPDRKRSARREFSLPSQASRAAHG